MAGVRPSALVAGVAGSVGGVQFRGGAGGGVAANRGKPSRSVTSTEYDRRRLVAFYSDAWRGLTADERAAWGVAGGEVKITNRAGAVVGMNGFQLFMHHQLARAPQLGGSVDPPPARVGRLASGIPEGLFDSEGAWWCGFGDALAGDDDGNCVASMAFPASRAAAPGRTHARMSCTGAEGLGEGWSGAIDSPGGTRRLAVSSDQAIPTNYYLEIWCKLSGAAVAQEWFVVGSAGLVGTINANGDYKLGLRSVVQTDSTLTVPTGEWVQLFMAVFGSLGYAYAGVNGVTDLVQLPLVWSAATGPCVFFKGNIVGSAGLRGKCAHASIWDFNGGTYDPSLGFNGGLGLNRTLYAGGLGVYSVKLGGGGRTPNLNGTWTTASWQGGGTVEHGPWARQIYNSAELFQTNCAIQLDFTRVNAESPAFSPARGRFER